MEGHLTPTECGEIATKMGCKRLILTHFLPSVLEIDISSLVKTKYDGEIILAIDGMKLEV
jgi:ribonuclease BN (tRNA processing enzyme)